MKPKSLASHDAESQMRGAITRLLQKLDPECRVTAHAHKEIAAVFTAYREGCDVAYQDGTRK